MKKYISFVITIALAAMILACSNDDETNPQPPTNNTVNLKFNFLVGDEELVLDDRKYILNSEDTISINQFKFFVSNVTFHSPAGETWLDEGGYYLVKANEGSHIFDLAIEGAPFDQISRVEFYLGLDSAMNFKPLDFPILFQSEGMYWDWNTGYKFMMFEGFYHSTLLGLPGNATGFVVHIGDMINLNTYDFSLEGEINVSGSSTLNFDVDLAEVFTDPNVMRLNDVNNRNIMGGPRAALISENYAEGMIKYTGATE